MWQPGSRFVHTFWYVGAGPGFGVAAGGTLQFGVVQVDRPTDITGLGVQVSGFLAWEGGIAGGAFRDVPGVPGPSYYGATFGGAGGAGAAIGAELTYARYTGTIDQNDLPPAVRDGFCQAP